MDVYFTDTSALSKRYVSETGSAWVRATLDPAVAEVYVARITAVEMISAITRRERGGSLTPPDAAIARSTFRLDLANEYQIVELTDAVAQRAMILAESHGLRAYDAVQLASAAELNALRITRGLPPLTLLSSDAEISAAAGSEGIAVEDPNAHP